MLQTLSKNWWMLAIKGALLLIFGVFAFIKPTITAASLAIWFATIIIADGIFTIIAAVRSWQEREDKWLILADGTISLILGLLLFITPGITLMIISFTIAFWFIFSGISRMAMAIQLRKEIEGEGWLILGGVLSVAFGLIIFAHPALGYGSLIWIIGLFSVIAGLAILMVSYKLRKGGAWVKDRLQEMKEQEPA